MKPNNKNYVSAFNAFWDEEGNLLYSSCGFTSVSVPSDHKLVQQAVQRMTKIVVALNKKINKK